MLFAALTILLCGCGSPGVRAGPSHLRELGSIPLPGVEGRFDHFARDPQIAGCLWRHWEIIRSK